ncbi:MAG TPA: hypothetical protein VN238_09985 [Solirubrobacteraceae bacterium]|nr:hypothetical protein [Solirubrobacteraceae bacterium]
MQVIRDAHPDDPLLDMAATHALLRAVGTGEHGPSARVFVPGPTMAFGRLDALRPGFTQATQAARDHGFTPVLRLGGGHAAAYDSGSVIVELVVPTERIAEGIEERFRAGTQLVADALEAAGVPTPTIGELPGEYCPGTWSVHARGTRIKLAGTAQRSISGASSLSAVVVAEHGPTIRAALTDVYAALDLEWDPRTAGAANDVAPGVTTAHVVQATIAEIATRWPGETTHGTLTPATLADARTLAGRHRTA